MNAKELQCGSAPPGRRRLQRPPRCECRLLGTIVLDGRRVPLGPCWVRQRHQEMLLCWSAADGVDQQRVVEPKLLRQLFDEGVLERL